MSGQHELRRAALEQLAGLRFDDEPDFHGDERSTRATIRTGPSSFEKRVPGTGERVERLLVECAWVTVQQLHTAARRVLTGAGEWHDEERKIERLRCIAIVDQVHGLTHDQRTALLRRMSDPGFDPRQRGVPGGQGR